MRENVKGNGGGLRGLQFRKWGGHYGGHYHYGKHYHHDDNYDDAMPEKLYVGRNSILHGNLN